MTRLLVLYFENDPKPISDRLHDRIDCWRTQGRRHGVLSVKLNLGMSFPLSWVRLYDPDAIILDATLLRRRWTQDQLIDTLNRLRELGLECGLVVAAPHDEFTSTDNLKSILEAASCDLVLTCLKGKDIATVYGETDFKFHTVLPAQISPRLRRLGNSRHLSLADRAIDIFYRTGTATTAFGRIGQLKLEIGKAFQSVDSSYGLNVDVEMGRDSFLPSDIWIKRLSQTRAVLGVESGSEVTNPNGQLFNRLKQSSLSLNAIKQAEPKLYRQINCLTLSARHLEAAVVKTPQFLVEGDYLGLFRAEEHYVCIREDMGNVDRVVEKLLTKDGLSELEQMADRLHKLVLGSYAFSEEAYTNPVFEQIVGTHSSIANRFIAFLLCLNDMVQRATLSILRLCIHMKHRFLKCLPK